MAPPALSLYTTIGTEGSSASASRTTEDMEVVLLTDRHISSEKSNASGGCCNMGGFTNGLPNLWQWIAVSRAISSSPWNVILVAWKLVPWLSGNQITITKVKCRICKMWTICRIYMIYRICKIQPMSHDMHKFSIMCNLWWNVSLNLCLEIFYDFLLVHSDALHPRYHDVWPQWEKYWNWFHLDQTRHIQMI